MASGGRFEMGDDDFKSDPPEQAPRPQLVAKKKSKKRNRKWVSDLAAVEIGPYLFLPLTSAKELRQEGRIMEHCIGTYDMLCRLGHFRVFSVRNAADQKHIATLALECWNNEWKLEQVKGLRNAEVLHQALTYFDGDQTVSDIQFTDLYYAVMYLVQHYREAWCEKKG